MRNWKLTVWNLLFFLVHIRVQSGYTVISTPKLEEYISNTSKLLVITKTKDIDNSRTIEPILKPTSIGGNVLLKDQKKFHNKIINNTNWFKPSNFSTKTIKRNKISIVAMSLPFQKVVKFFCLDNSTSTVSSSTIANLKQINEYEYEKIESKYIPQEFSSKYDFFTNYIYEHILELTKSVAPVIPGTIWCGIGNTARNDGMMTGYFRNTDNCCRQHDKCPNYIQAYGVRYGLKNERFFTKSHCDCDRDFYYCLKNTNTVISKKIGAGYFNILSPRCFRKEYPIIECLTWFEKRCVEYLVDSTKPEKWQWFDNRYF